MNLELLLKLQATHLIKVNRLQLLVIRKNELHFKRERHRLRDRIEQEKDEDVKRELRNKRLFT